LGKNPLTLDTLNWQTRPMTWGVVRIFAEYATDHPLWNGRGEQAVVPGLPSRDLARQFAEWNRRWDQLASDPDHEDDESWNSWQPALDWNAEGYRLARLLRLELPREVELIYYDYVTGEDVVIGLEGISR
jgi:hypothetical protein